ncbi:MAG: phosphotransferase [Planctomycetes bacterium]|nr:phosphotransferase [Planctomycetota bacterium]
MAGNCDITTEDIGEVLSNYDLGEISDVQLPGGGTANLNSVIETGRGRMFLRRRNPKYCTADQIIFDHDLMRHLARKCIPGPLPLETKEGRSWVQTGKGIFEVHRFIEGRPHDRTNLDQIKNAARELALFHLAGMDFKTTASKAWPRYDSPFLIRAALAGIESRVPAGHKGDLEVVRQQVARVAKDLSDKRYASLPRYVIHGDYHPANMLFRGDAVAGIFDLDWASRQPRVRDLADGVIFYGAERTTDVDGGDIASLTAAVTYNEERIRLFVSTYHKTLPLRAEEMALLPLFLRARWIHCRAAGMAKVPDEEKGAYFFKDIVVPLRWICEQEEALGALPD